jgi:hypothetical protein
VVKGRVVLRNLITKPRSAVTTLLEVAGLGVIVVGIFRVSFTFGLVAVGLALILVGVLEG